MTQTMDDLSIEELQNQLLEIQKKIKEKEKSALIDQVGVVLRDKDTEFIKAVLDVAIGKKSLAPKAQKTEAPEKAPSKFVGKSEVYLRGGRVYYGIQEVKYTRLDKNGILRISKDGKGLPPKVESLPKHIQKAVLALPQREEKTAAVQAVKQDEVISETVPVQQEASTEPAPVVVEELVEFEHASTADTVAMETDSVPEFVAYEPVQIDLVEQVAEVEAEMAATETVVEPTEPPRKRKPARSRNESKPDDAMDLSDPAPEPPPTESSRSKKVEIHVLQESFF